MKIDISKELCEKMARLEVGHSVEAGSPFEHLVQCPVCRGVDLEKSWCDTCNRTGVVNKQPAGQE